MIYYVKPNKKFRREREVWMETALFGDESLTVFINIGCL
jgi:hypothetical protein